MKAKRILQVSVLLILLVCLMALPVSAATIVDSGTCGAEGDNVTWTLDSDGLLTISGEGEMENFEVGAQPWADHVLSINEIVISDGVSTIGSYAFGYCFYTTKVSISESMKSIGSYAFYCCGSLPEVKLPEGTESIGEYAFSYCGTLTSVDLPESISNISSHAFEGSSLRSIIIGDNVEVIGNYAFHLCFGLGNVTLGDNVKFIGDYAFSFNDSITSISIPSSVTSIGNNAFYNCKNLTEILVAEDNSNYSNDNYGVLFNKDKTELIDAPDALSGAYQIPNSVINISEMAFMYCGKLTGISIPNSVTHIGANAFDRCFGLTNVTIPDSVIEMGKAAFYYCTGLTNITFGNGIKTIEPYTFVRCVNLVEIILPEGITTIENFAFRYCEGLSQIILPDSISTIGEEAFAYCKSLESITIPINVTFIGDRAFYACNALSEIRVDTNNLNYSSDSFGVLFDKNKTELIAAPGKISGCYQIPNNVTAIREYAMAGCVNLTGVNISDSVETIGNYAFQYCYLVNVNIGCKVKLIGLRAFESLGDCAKITFRGDAPSNGGNVFGYVENATSYYPAGNETWTEAVRQDYGGGITWVEYKPLKITQQPTSATVAKDAKATVKVIAEGEGLTYKWYFKDVGATMFSLTTSFTGDTYSVAMSAARSGRQIYCVITDKYGNSVQSDTVTLSMEAGAAVKITQEPKSVVVAEGAKATVKVVAEGEGLTYKWYFKDQGATKYSYTSSFKSNTYSISMTEARNGRYVYCKVTDAYGNTVKSKTVSLRMQTPLAITAQPKTSYTQSGATAKATVKATGDGLTYQWYIKNAGATKYSKSSITSATYSVKMSSTSKDRLVYCVITDKYGNSVKCDTVRLRMAATITTQPTGVSVASGSTAKVTVKATGDELTYTWYIKNATGTKFSKSSVTGSTYSCKMSSTSNGRQVYCVVQDKYGNTVTSNTVTLKMK